MTFKHLFLTFAVGTLLLSSVFAEDSKGGSGRRSRGNGRENDTRGIPEEHGDDAQGFRGLSIRRQLTDGTDIVYFSLRAFPVPRIWVRYFDSSTEASDPESLLSKPKLEFTATIPAFFEYSNADSDVRFTSGDSLVNEYKLRAESGDAWDLPKVSNETLLNTEGEAVTVFKFVVCRKIQDFCLIAFVANGTVSYESRDLTADSCKIDILLQPENFETKVSQGNYLAAVIKVNYMDKFGCDDKSGMHEPKNGTVGELENNDVEISADKVAVFFNWDKFVEVTFADNSTKQVELLSAEVSGILPIDRKVAEAKHAGDHDEEEGSGQGSEGGSEGSGSGSYSSNLEDPSVKDRMSNAKVYAFTINTPAGDITKILWDPDTGITSANSALARSVLLAVVVLVIALLAVLL